MNSVVSLTSFALSFTIQSYSGLWVLTNTLFHAKECRTVDSYSLTTPLDCNTLTMVVLIRVVGIILVIALLTIPAALARQFTHDIKRMLLAVLFGAFMTFGGLWLCYELDLASGATIVLLSGAMLLAVFGFSKLRSKGSRILH